MGVNTIEVSPVVLDWVSKSTKLTEKSQKLLDLWKSGEKQPTFNQLESFSNNTHIPIGYFFLLQPPKEECEILQFRTVDSLALQNPSRNLLDTVRQMENIQEWMKEFLLSINSDPIGFVGSIDKSKSINITATNVREVLGITKNWFTSIKGPESSFKFLRQKMSALGIIVMVNGIVGSNTHRSLDIEEFRAFTLVDSHAPLIFVNAVDSKGGKLFSLLHEFIHIGIGRNSLFNALPYDSNYIDPVETFCNALTAEILVPQDLFQIKFEAESGTPNERIRVLAEYFNCSIVVVARRALDFRYIEQGQYYKIALDAKKDFDELKKNRKREKGKGDFYKTNAIRMDHRFLLALDMSLREGKTLHTDAFRLTNTNRVTFKNLVSEIRDKRS